MGPHGSRATVMSKENRGESWVAQLMGELARTDIYKRSQGRMVRQLTCLAIWVAVGLASYRMFEYLRVVGTNLHPALIYALPVTFLVVGLWLGYRIVNLASFADFLIAVEAEMNKVSWPSRTELIRASLVVIVLMFGLAIVLFGYDFVLNFLFSRVLKVTIV
jgi:preprotein translocase subunit SecE